jgi:DNA-binding CsgD family transcriptional regulator
VPDLLPDLHKFLNFLNQRPTIDELGRRYLQDFVFMLQPITLSFLSLSPLNEISVEHITGSDQSLGDFGKPSQYQQLCESFNAQNLISDLMEKQVLLDRQSRSIISTISNGKVVNGLVKLDCETVIMKKHLQLIHSYSPLISFYLFPTFHSQGSSISLSSLQLNPLTPRQGHVLAGFIEGKTNHELAVELGFSISTIRHETMAIFKLLGASDRKEAAKIAQEVALI